MSIKLNFSKKWSALLIAVLALSACGKNMHLTLKPIPEGVLIAPKVTGDKLVTPPVKTAQSEAAGDDKSGAAQDGQILPLSHFDEADPSLNLPFLNERSPETVYRTLGDPSYSYEENSANYGFLKHSNFVFRAVHLVAPKEMIADVLKFELHLKGVRVLIKKDADSIGLQNQILCVIDTGNCAGAFPDSEAGIKNLNSRFIAQIHNNILSPDAKLDAHLSNADGSILFQSEKEIVIDLKQAFGLRSMKPSEIADWLYANSKEFAKPGYRKFRFVIGNNVYFDSGELVLQVSTGVQTLPADYAETPSIYANGESDVGAGDKLGLIKLVGVVNPVLPLVKGIAPVGPIVPPVTALSAPSIISPVVLSTEPVITTAKNGSLLVKLSDSVLAFRTNKATLSKKEAARLKQMGSVLKDNQELIKRVLVRAQTDQVGKAIYNKHLSDRRAHVVAKLLLLNGFETKKIQKLGLGEPKVSACAPLEECAKDRIVTLKIDLADHLSEADKKSIQDKLMPLLMEAFAK